MNKQEVINTDGCRALWSAVIERAFTDACLPITRRSPGPARIDQRIARNWLLADHMNFERVCDYAGLDASGVRAKAQRLAEDGWQDARGVYAAA